MTQGLKLAFMNCGAIARHTLGDLRNAGATLQEVGWLERRLRTAEFKRHQAPPGLKVSWTFFPSG